MEILGNSRHLQYLQYSLLPSFLMTGTESPQVPQSPGRFPRAGKWPLKSAKTGLSAGHPRSLGMTLWRAILSLACLLFWLPYLLPCLCSLTLSPNNCRSGDHASGQEKMAAKLLEVYRNLFPLRLQGRGEHGSFSLGLWRAHHVAAPQV